MLTAYTGAVGTQEKAIDWSKGGKNWDAATCKDKTV
jgi:hypothetical protein